jgi:hypothetical protein
MTFDHVFWGYKQVPNGIIVNELLGYDESWRINTGIDLGTEFPSDAYFEMDQDFPESTVLTDHVRNQEALILISDRLKAFIEKMNVPNIQFLPATIKDHEDRALKQQYFVVNPIGPIDCFDLKASKPTYDDLVESKVVQMEAFVPDKDKCVDLPDIFRPKGFKHLLISKKLAKEIDGAGMTGNGWVPPKKLAGEDIPPSLRGLTS